MKNYLKNSLVLFLTVIGAFCTAQNQSANTSNIDFRFNDGKIYITYDIVNSATNELYNITTTVYREDGSKLNAISLSGDIFEVKGGNGKIIVWEQNKDGYVLDEKIYVTLGIATKVNIPLAKHLLKSTVFPGWGDYKVRNGKFHFLYGVAGFGAIGAAIYMNNQANQSYTNYKQSLDFSESNNLFNKAKQQQTLSYVFASTAALVWTFDLATLVYKTHKVKKNITPENSKYYFNKTQQTNTFTSNTNSINTKLPYDIALERGDKLLVDEQYDAAKIAYEEAKNYNETETIKNKLDAINKIIEEDKNRTTAYNASLEKAQSLLAQKQYKEAKAEFETANKLKPKEKYPLTKISQIDELLAQIENQGLYESQINKGITYLQSQDFETAKSYFETALKYKPADPIAINKIKECENGLAMKEQSRIENDFKQKMIQANNLLATKNYDEALEIFEQANELKPNASEPISKIAICENAINKRQEAADDAEYTKAMTQADIAWKKQKYDEAKAFYEKALRLKPNESLAHVRLDKINKINSEDASAPKNSQADLVSKYTSAVLYIVNSDGFSFSQGSGFLVSSDGIAVSNYHVFEGMSKDKSKITFENGETYGVKEVIEKSKEGDYIIFRLDCPSNKKFNYFKYNNTEPKLLQEVITIGSPDGIGFIAEDGKIIKITKENIFHNVNITHGNSGGPLINMQGEVIGITSGGVQTENREYKYAIKISTLRLSRWVNN